MSEFIDIEKYIEDSLVKSIRVLLSLDSRFTFNVENPRESKVMVTGAKPRDTNLTIPHAYISNVSYRIGDMGLNKGFLSDIIDGEGREGQKFVFKADFSSTISVSSIHSSTAKDFCNRIVDWMYIKGREFMEDNLRVKLSGMRKTQGGKVRLGENNELFTENISIEGSVYIETTVTSINLSGILEIVNLNLDLQ